MIDSSQNCSSFPLIELRRLFCLANNEVKLFHVKARLVHARSNPPLVIRLCQRRLRDSTSLHQGVALSLAVARRLRSRRRFHADRGSPSGVHSSVTRTGDPLSRGIKHILCSPVGVGCWRRGLPTLRPVLGGISRGIAYAFSLWGMARAGANDSRNGAENKSNSI